MGKVNEPNERQNPEFYDYLKWMGGLIDNYKDQVFIILKQDYVLVTVNRKTFYLFVLTIFTLVKNCKDKHIYWCNL